MPDRPLFDGLAHADLGARRVTLVRLEIAPTYDGLLEGVPDPDRWLARLSTDRSGAPVVVLPCTREPGVAGLPDTLPRFAFTLDLASDRGLAGSDVDGSHATVRWLHDHPGLLPAEVLAAVAPLLDWEAHARDVWL